MPTYTFREVTTNEPVELTMSMAEYEERCEGRESIEWEGRTLTRDFFADRPGGHRSQCWPMTSTAAGVHPDQIGEYKAAGRAAGVDVDFTRNGDAIFKSRGHRKQCLKLWKMRDRDGGYGD